MRSAYKVFTGTTGYEEVLSRASEFVTRLGREHLIGINTVVDPSEMQIAGIGSRMARGAYAETVVVIVWCWEPT